MRYRLTCLTPLLVGDGRRLSPIDYMVWKDQVNVLDQTRIFRLLSKGTRLDNYLTQIRRADKLDFAAWGGFAQNFADRRIPFEHAAYTGYWQKARPEHLFIQTFAAGPRGPYVPGTAIKGALRTGMVFTRWNGNVLRDLAERMQEDRVPRNPAQQAEQNTVGSGGASRLRVIMAGDSEPRQSSDFRIYLLRVSTLQAGRGAERYNLGWKQAGGGTVDGARPEESTPIFAEMAAPGTAFEGHWKENEYLRQPEILRLLRWREAPSRARIFEAANQYAGQVLALHSQYASQARLPRLATAVEQLQERLSALRTSGAGCLLALGWGTGLLGKSGILDTSDESYRNMMRAVPAMGRAIRSGLPFPKTRRIVFLENEPATLPGWVSLEVTG